MLLSTHAMRPSMVHSIVDSFFEMKKAEVKSRLRDQLDQMVDGLFGEMVTTVKELLLPPEQAKPPAKSTQTQGSSAEQQVADSPAPAKIFATKSVPAPSFLVPGTSGNIGKRRRTRSSKSSAESKKGNGESMKRARIGSSADSLASLKTDADPIAINSKVPRKYVCPSEGCGQSFTQSSDLKRHERRIHLGVKPFLCKWSGCSYSSATRDTCLRHIRNIHLKPNAKVPDQVDESPPDKDPSAYIQELTDLL